jgi:hypothetical protein
MLRPSFPDRHSRFASVIHVGRRALCSRGRFIGETPCDIIASRVTGRIEGDFGVFLIGMRINKPWKLHKWLSVVRAMPKMLRELEAASQFRGQFFRARSMISGLYSK